MPTIITHGLSAVILGRGLFKIRPRLLFWSAFLAMLPDGDVIGFLFGVEYSSFWGHRGFSHSLLFAFVVGGTIAFLFQSRLRHYGKKLYFWVLYFSLIIASHGLFDGLTNGGLGIAYFSPFNNKRYFLPWTPVQVSPIGINGFFSQRGLNLILSEATYILAPCFLVLLLAALMRATQSKSL